MVQNKTSISKKGLFEANASLRAQLAETREALQAITSGDVDALVNTDPGGHTRIYTLHGADEPYRLMLETMSEGAAMVSEQTIILYCNQRLSAFLKLPLQAVLGAEMTRFVCQADQSAFLHLLEMGLRGFARGNISLLCADNSLVPVQLACSVLPGAEPKVISVVATDMTEHMRARRELLAARADLELKVRERTAKLRESISELEAFSYSLAHDLRAPLRAIIGFTQLVVDEIQSTATPATLDHLRKVICAAMRMDRLVLDLLAMSKLSQQHFKMDRVDLDGLLEQIIAERPELQPPQLELHVHHPLLPVLGHEGLLTQCLTNLLSNAVKFVRHGIKAKVEISTEARGSEVRLWVADNGIGISADSQSKLFQIFGRVHSASQYEGTGIGLVVVRRAVEHMGGQFGCESEPGKGSRFWIQLARAK